MFNPCGEFRWSPEGRVSQVSSPYLHAGTPGIFSDLLMSVQILKKECGANGSYCIYPTQVKLQSWFLSLRWKTLFLSRTAALVPALAMKNLPSDRTFWWWSYNNVCSVEEFLELSGKVEAVVRNCLLRWSGPLIEVAATPSFRSVVFL